jgi:hypothetical protein
MVTNLYQNWRMNQWVNRCRKRNILWFPKVVSKSLKVCSLQRQIHLFTYTSVYLLLVSITNRKDHKKSRLDCTCSKYSLTWAAIYVHMIAAKTTCLADQLTWGMLRLEIWVGYSMLLRTCLVMKAAKCWTVLSNCKCLRPGITVDKVAKYLIITKSLWRRSWTFGCRT